MRWVARVLFAVVTIAASSCPAATQGPHIEDVLSTVTLAFRSDGSFDRAMLVSGADGEADIYVFHSLLIGEVGARPVLDFLKRSVVSTGGWGQGASLGVTKQGFLAVHSLNDAIGRNRWSQTLTVVWRNGTYLVAGIAYTSRDTLAPGAGGSCDLDLLSGKGTRDGKPVAGPFAPIDLSDWSDDKMPSACVF